MNERDRKEKKDRLVKLAEEFYELYHDVESGFAGISYAGDEIQLIEYGMEWLFPNAKFECEPFNEKYDKIITTYRGKRFIALVDKEEE